MFLAYVNRETLWEIYYSIKESNLNNFEKNTKNIERPDTVKNIINKIQENIKPTINVQTPHLDSTKLFNEIEFDMQIDLAEFVYNKLNKKSKGEFLERMHNILNKKEENNLGNLYKEFAPRASYEEHF
jgi:hypothetical protein